MATWIKAGFWEKLCKPCKGYKGWLNLDELIASIAGKAEYKIYRAILFQDGTASAPTAYVLENTLGTTPVWIYKGVGDYTADLGLGILDATKIHSLCTLDQNGNAYFAWMGVENNPPAISDNIEIITYDNNDSNIEMGGYISIEIKVYP